MPARSVITATADELAALFALPAVGPLRPRYNAAPQQDIPVVRLSGTARELVHLRWGLVPHWNTDPAAEGHVNARSETVASKPSFKDAFASRRCLVPFSGFYGWKPTTPRKTPYFFRPKIGAVFVCAGIWDRCELPGGAVETVSVLTMPANALVMPTDPRMPVVVSSIHFEAWLDPTTPDPERLLKSFVPFPADRMECWPVSTRVNDPAHDDAKLITPLTPTKR